MAREHGPYSVGFPVNFTSGGDTTRDAFRKHMDEITRIYGILTGIDADTMDADAVSDMLQKHIDSTNPHPNYKPSVSWANVTNKPGLNDLSGTLSASKVVGDLTNATIDSGKVVGLRDFIRNLSSGTLYNSDAGYTNIYGTAFVLQWGNIVITREEYARTREAPRSANFSKAFTSECYVVIAGTGFKTSGDVSELNTMMQVIEKSKTGFKYVPQIFVSDAPIDADEIYCNYIALGV